MSKCQNFVNNQVMKKFIFLCFFAFCLCYFGTYNIDFINGLNSFSLGEYSIICENDFELKNVKSKVKNGDYYIYNFDKNYLPYDVDFDNVLAEEFRTTESQKVKDLVKNLCSKIVKIEYVENIKITYYFSLVLHKQICTDWGTFNLSVVENNEQIILGYPAVVSSF